MNNSNKLTPEKFKIYECIEEIVCVPSTGDKMCKSDLDIDIDIDNITHQVHL